jgi:hypothetical protein
LTEAHRTQFLLVLLLFVVGCKDAESTDDGTNDPHADQVESCTHNCLKPLCSGNITSSPDYDSVCRAQCEDRVTQAEDDDCLQEYESLLACLEETSCETYYLWYEQEPNAPCVDLEAEFVNSCPSIDVRDSD